ncbi:hypothetical protein OPV22_018342 [Ensete ventricosum]|uniref:Ig-like domain-containing protein n=1 Tax=Ensete ventricosum TaxID=4639 RepID=A0AAV8R044_ENSVE|nr:hypothetical protein OPV22_018342 [Ensete ventricosum]
MAFEGPEELPHSFVGVSELSTERGWGLPPAPSSQLLLRPSFGFSSSSPAQKPSPHLYSVLPSCHLRTALHCCPQLAQGVVEVAWLSSAEPTNATDSSIDMVSPSCCLLCPQLRAFHDLSPVSALVFFCCSWTFPEHLASKSVELVDLFF